ncbi:hypothetical protein E6H35_03695 [Candidatus Bathyarchaeota archaeon]|nr:MAG: hypothetical protein E6H35_03695 [Candidatus Bathyarchaeota archaeon]
MAENKLALLKESVSFTKSNEDALMKGDFEVYDDRIVVKISQRVALSTLVRPLPPTFPGVGMMEFIPFLRITRIGGTMKKGSLSRNVRMEMLTDDGVIWNIKGSPKIFGALQNAYQAWKRNRHE